MLRYINADRIIALQFTTPADNPLVSDDNRLIDVWFQGTPIRKQMFKKIRRAEQDALISILNKKGFVSSGNLLLDPRAVLFAEMENEILGGVVTLGFGEGGKAVEFKIGSKAFSELVVRFNSV